MAQVLNQVFSAMELADSAQAEVVERQQDTRPLLQVRVDAFMSMAQQAMLSAQRAFAENEAHQDTGRGGI